MESKGKLVRDRIPEIIERSGGRPDTRVLSAAERLPALLDKLEEEAAELRAASALVDQTEELADVLEVARAIAAELGLAWAIVEEEVEAKRIERGGFDDGIWLAAPGRAAAVEREPATGSTAIAAAVSFLSDAANAHPAREFPAGQPNVDEAGLYAWRVDEVGRAQISAVFGVDVPDLIYAGQAGASSSQAGIERGATLRSRIRGNHLKGNIGSSTFRKTLTAVLFEPLGLQLEKPGKVQAASNAAITAWMHDHLSVATFAVLDRSTLSDLEHAVLLELDPPLNLMGMAPNQTRTVLRKLRSNVS